ncbi:MAG: glycosyltransferase family 4 protein [Anaerolineaceae bacterium]|nr:glycosyltransferase family 4 protein [Anaerolineaceae bacterium]
MRILFVLPCTPFFPSGIVRVQQFFPFLDAAGIGYRWVDFNTPRVQRWLHWLDRSIFARWRWSNLALRALIHLSGFPYRWLRMAQIWWWAPHYDLVFLQAILPPAWFSRALAWRNPQVVFDYDDALYVRSEKRTAGVIRSAWKVVAGSHALFEFARRHNPRTVLIPSSVDVKNYMRREEGHGHTPLRLGWIGSVSTIVQLEILAGPLQRLLEKGILVELFLAGTRGRRDLYPRLEGIPILEVETYTNAQIPQLTTQFDIGVMPLFDTPIERGKCAMKALIYMAGGVPVVSSAVGEAGYVIQPGQNGYLARDEQAWATTLEALIHDPALRARVGAAGRQTVESKYSVEVCYHLLEEYILRPAMGE